MSRRATLQARYPSEALSWRDRNAPVLAHHIARTSSHADLENMHLNCPNPLERGTCAYAVPDNARVRSRRRLRLVWAVGRWAQ